MYKYYFFITTFLIFNLLFNSCSNYLSDDENNQPKPNDSSYVIDDTSEVIGLKIFTTSNVNTHDIFVDFLFGLEVDSTSNWHVSIIKDIANYNMPSIIMNAIQIAIYEDTSFESITTIPSNFESVLIDDNNSFGYGDANEVLSYDITVHKVSVSNPDLIYLLKFNDASTNVFKLQFIEYQSGITVFQYEKIN
jgi:hypothetical protein|tara:strand:- start:1117 stop:1692 length:576 start_codon:yes stop_codon:yes gene_type:complete